jgi:hypothetical protein
MRLCQWVATWFGFLLEHETDKVPETLLKTQVVGISPPPASDCDDDDDDDAGKDLRAMGMNHKTTSRSCT